MKNSKLWLRAGLAFSVMFLITGLALAIAGGFVWLLWAAYNG